jgi:hypothetical protein
MYAAPELIEDLVLGATPRPVCLFNKWRWRQSRYRFRMASHLLLLEKAKLDSCRERETWL